MSHIPGVQRGAQVFLYVLFLCFSLSVQPAKADYDSGLAYLASQVQLDGSVTNGGQISTDYQASCEAYPILIGEGVLDGTQQAAAQQYILDDLRETVPVITCKAKVLDSLGLESSLVVEPLIGFQNLNGGIGEALFFSASPLDSAIALQALETATNVDAYSLNGLLYYLVYSQSSDGSFAVFDPANDSAYVTAEVLIALSKYRLDFDLDLTFEKGESYLLSRLGSLSGLSYWEQGKILTALVNLNPDRSAYQPLIDNLQSNQAANGSWDDDVFTTAIVLEALELEKNLTELPVQLATLSGRVLDPLTSQPIQGATVSVGAAGDPAQTNALGIYEVQVEPSQTITFEVSHPQYNTYSTSLSLDATLVVNLNDVYLTRVDDSALVFGIITDGSTGVPIEGATITLTGATTIQFVTDILGEFLGVVPSGSYNVAIAADGFHTSNLTINLPNFVTVDFSQAMTPDTEPLPTSNSVSGVILDIASAEPIENALVELAGQTVNTNILGEFYFEDVTPGLQTLAVSKAGFGNFESSFLVPDTQDVNLTPIYLEEVVTPTTLTLSGTVTDSETGSFISGATVSIASLGLSTQTDQEGNYLIEDITSLNFLLSVEAIGYVDWEGTLTANAYGAVQTNIGLQQSSVANFEIVDVVPELSGIYEAYGEAELKVYLLNKADEERQVRLWAKILDADGNVVDSFPQRLSQVGDDGLAAQITLPVQEEIMTPIEWYFFATPPGEYQFVVQVVEDGQLIGERSALIEILPSTMLGGSGAFSPPLATYTEDLQVQLSAFIQNSGNLDMDESVVTAKVYLDAADEEFTADARTVYFDDELLVDAVQIDSDGTNVYALIASSPRSVVKVLPNKTMEVIYEDDTGSSQAIDVTGTDTFVLLRNVFGTYSIRQVQSDGSYEDLALDFSQLPSGSPSIFLNKIVDLENGTYLVATNASVWRRETDGALTNLITDGVSGGEDVVVDANGDAYIASADGLSFGQNGAVVKYSGGVFSEFYTLDADPADLTIDGNGQVVASLVSGELIRIAADGGSASVIATASIDDRYFDAVDYNPADGWFYATNADLNRVYRINDVGQQESMVQPMFSDPVNMFDNNGALTILERTCAFQVQDSGFLFNGVSITPCSYTGQLARDFAPGTNGSFYALLTNGIHETQADGSTTQILSEGGNSFTLNAGGDGFLVSDTDGIRDVKFGGSVQDFLPYVHTSSYDVYSSPDGVVYVLTEDALLRLQSDATYETVMAVPRNRTTTSSRILYDGTHLFISSTSWTYISQIASDGTETQIPLGSMRGLEMHLDTSGQVVFSAVGGGPNLYVLDGAGSYAPYLSLSGTSDVADFSFDYATNNVWYLQASALYMHDGLTDTQVASSVSGTELEFIDDQIIVRQSRVLRYFDTSGTLIRQNNTGLPIPTSMAHFGANDEVLLFRQPSTFYFVRPGDVIEQRIVAGNIRELTQGSAGNLFGQAGSRMVKLEQSKLPLVFATGSYNFIDYSSALGLVANTNFDVFTFDETTGASTEIISNLPRIGQMAVQADGTIAIIYAGDSGDELAYFESDGTLIDARTNISSLRDVIAASGKVLLAIGNSGVFELLAPNSVEQVIDSPPTNFNPVDLVAAGSDQVIVNDTVSGLFNLDLVSGSLTAIPDDILNPAKIALLPTGNLIVLDNTKVYDLDPVTGISSVISGSVSTITKVIADTASDYYLMGKEGLFSFNDQSFSLVSDEVNMMDDVVKMPDGSFVFADFAGHYLFKSEDLEVFKQLSTYGTYLTLNLTSLDNGAIIDLEKDTSSIFQIILVDPASLINQVVYETQITFPASTAGEQGMDFDLGSWHPPAAGSYRLAFETEGGVGNQFSQTDFYVGATASASFALASSTVDAGDHLVDSSLSVVGINNKSFTQILADQIRPEGNSMANGRGLAGDSMGNIYVDNITSLTKMAPDGTTTSIGSFTNMVQSLAVDNDDNVYMAEGTVIYKLTPDGTLSEFHTFSQNVQAFTAHLDGKLYVILFDGSIYEFSDVITTPQLLMETGLQDPYAITVDINRDFYIIKVERSGNPNLGFNGSLIYKQSLNGSQNVFFDRGGFELEGANMVADCNDNILFAQFYDVDTGNFLEERIIEAVNQEGQRSLVLDGTTVNNDFHDIDVLYYDRFNSRLLMYTDLSDGAIYSMPVTCGGLSLELHMVASADTPLQQTDVPADLVLDLGNGEKEYVWSFDNVDYSGQTLNISWNFLDLQLGENRSAVIDAYLQVNNTFEPGSPIRVPIDIPSISVESPLSFEVSLDDDMVLPDALLAGHALVTNDGPESFNGELLVTIVDDMGYTVEMLPAITINGLPGNSTQIFNFDWNSGQYLAGDYAVIIELVDESQNVLDSTEAAFSIIASETGDNIEATIYSLQSSYAPWANVVIEARVRNTTSNYIQEAANAEIEVLDPNGVVIYSDTFAVNELMPGSYVDVQRQLNLSEAQAGVYTINFAVTAQDGTEIATGTNDFVVVYDLSTGLDGAVTVDLSQIEVGDSNQCHFTLANNLGSQSQSFTATYAIRTLDGSSLIDSQTEALQLAGYSSHTFDYTIPTSLVEGDYACTVSIDISGEITDLAGVGFRVNPAVIDISGVAQVTSAVVELDDPNTCSLSVTNNRDKDTPSIAFTYEVTNADATQVLSSVIANQSIAANTTVQLASFPLSTQTEGQYQCRLLADINEETVVLASDVYEVTPVQVDVTGTVTAQLTSVEQDEANQCDFTLVNNRTRSTPDLTLTYRVLSGATEILSASESVVVAANATHTYPLTIPANQALGSYTCRFDMVANGEPSTLVTTNFDVIPVHVEVSSSSSVDNATIEVDDSNTCRFALTNLRAKSTTEIGLAFNLMNGSGQSVASESRTVTLTANETQEQAFNVSGLAEDTYQCTATYTANNETTAFESQSFAVIPVQANVSGTVGVAPTEIEEGETAVCTFIVQNQRNKPSPELTLSYVLESVYSSFNYSETESVSLPALGSHSYTLTTPPTLEEDSYRCVLNVAATGQNETLDEAGFNVTAPAIVLTGEVTVLKDALRQYDEQSCTYIINNDGSSNVTALPVWQLLNDENNAVVSETISYQDIAAGGSVSITEDIDTSSLPEGQYTCQLDAGFDGEVQTLGQATFTLLEALPSCNNDAGNYLIDGVLYIVGTANRDYINVSNDENQWRVLSEDKDSGAVSEDWFDKSEVERFEVFACDGEDHVQMASVDTHTNIYGGEGNDLLHGSQAGGTMCGEDGDDHIMGKKGDDIIFGGKGVDKIQDVQGNNQVYQGEYDDEGNLGCVWPPEETEEPSEPPVQSCADNPSTTLTDGVIVIHGTDGNDLIEILKDGSQWKVVNDYDSGASFDERWFDRVATASIEVHLCDGEDEVKADAVKVPTYIFDADANDQLSGSNIISQ